MVDMTLPGMGGGGDIDVPEPPKMIDAKQAIAARRGTQKPRSPAHITNKGGGGGIPVQGSVQRALKTLGGGS